MQNVSSRKRNKITPRPARSKVLAERKREKVLLKKSLEWGDAAFIHAEMNKAGEKISYLSVINTLNINSQFYSKRVVDFTKKYIQAKEAIKNR